MPFTLPHGVLCQVNVVSFAEKFYLYGAVSAAACHGRHEAQTRNHFWNALFSGTSALQVSGGPVGEISDAFLALVLGCLRAFAAPSREAPAMVRRARR